MLGWAHNPTVEGLNRSPATNRNTLYDQERIYNQYYDWKRMFFSSLLGNYLSTSSKAESALSALGNPE